MAASSALGIVSGIVTRVKHRSGTARNTGNPYEFYVVTVLVAGKGVAEVNLGGAAIRELGGVEPANGSSVSWLCDFGTGQYGLSVEFVEEFDPTDSPLSFSHLGASA
jgi:hypothetical protein